MLVLLACVVDSPGPGKGHSDPTTDSATDAPTDTSTGSTTDTATTTCPEVAPPVSRTPGASPRPARALDGEVTWTVGFNDAGHRAGYRDCSYTRTYTAFAETLDLGWLCPSCDFLARGTAVMTRGHESCYAQISGSEAERVEQLGIATVGGERRLFRSGTENLILADVGAITGEGTLSVAWRDAGALDYRVQFSLQASGTLTLSETSAVLDDPQDPREEPYACSWPLDNPGGANGSFELQTGATFPNFRLEDACGERFSLWDLRGRYLVLDASSPDCGPCQAMAAAAPAFEAEMAAECLPVATVTLLNERLSAINGTASAEVRADWAATFGLVGPVLGDEGFGYARMAPYIGTEGGMSLPTWAIVAPDGRLVAGGSGYSDASGGWTEIADLIRADAATH